MCIRDHVKLVEDISKHPEMEKKGQVMGRVAQGVKIKVGKMKDNQCNNNHWAI